MANGDKPADKAAGKNEKKNGNPEPPPIAQQSAATVEMVQELALGNGTRQKGEVLATIRCAKGVTIGEVQTALANPHCFTLKPPS